MSGIAQQQAQEDFARARRKAQFELFLSSLQMKRSDLLSLYDVKELLRPKTETYIGVKPIPISRIVGSEGRYQDFNSTFFPKKEMLRGRWQSIDRAHMQYVELPPISVYKIGDAYFVRDGNHRVSVAKSRGIEYVDATIVELGSEITPEPGMSMRQLKKKVIEYERQRFLEAYQLTEDRLITQITFTSPGRYTEMLHHINVHKYYLNEDRNAEIPFEEAADAWYEHVYLPIIENFRENRVLGKFPGRTEGDLYMWVVRHWEELREKYHSDLSVEHAARDLTEKYGLSYWERVKRTVTSLFRKHQ